jgi:hypothetical protein
MVRTANVFFCSDATFSLFYLLLSFSLSLIPPHLSQSGLPDVQRLLESEFLATRLIDFFDFQTAQAIRNVYPGNPAKQSLALSSLLMSLLLLLLLPPSSSLARMQQQQHQTIERS